MVTRSLGLGFVLGTFGSLFRFFFVRSLHFKHNEEQHDGLHDGDCFGFSTYVPRLPSLMNHSDNAL